jgi:hypothetical protein
MGTFKSFWPLIQSFILSQGRGLLAAAGGILVTDGVLHANQTDDFLGSAFFLLTVVLQAVDVFVVNKKVETALASSPPGTIIVPAQTLVPSTQGTMS